MYSGSHPGMPVLLKVLLRKCAPPRVGVVHSGKTVSQNGSSFIPDLVACSSKYSSGTSIGKVTKESSPETYTCHLGSLISNPYFEQILLKIVDHKIQLIKLLTSDVSGCPDGSPLTIL